MERPFNMHKHKCVHSKLIKKMKKSFFELCKKAGTDKVNPHGYHFFYPSFLERIRDEKFNMLEIGYGKGQSMKMWCEYFSKCNFFCADIDCEGVVNDRCRVIKANQSKEKDLQKIVKEIGTAKLIIDDGSHNPKHQFDTFTYLFEHLLADEGIYIIEDIETSYWESSPILYGFMVGNFNLMENTNICRDMINQEFSKVKNALKISTMTYGQNCIIFTKQSKEEQRYFDRTYRFDALFNKSNPPKEASKPVASSANIDQKNLSRYN